MALDDEGVLRAIATTGGVEVMMHIGLDTVQLKGQGFTPRVKAGETVRTGTPLIDFDADYIAIHAKSLLTQIVITTMDRVARLAPRSGVVTAGADAVLELTLTETGELNAFRPGVQQIVETTPVPVLPMALSGLWGSFFSRSHNGRAMRRLRGVFSRIALVVGPAIPPERVVPDDLAGIVLALRGERR